MATFVGIDVAKRTFEAAWPDEAGFQTCSLPNTEEGFEQLCQKLPPDAIGVMEASGPYGYRLATYLDAQHVTVAIVNPLVIRRYAQVLLRRNKTDANDAILIADYAQRMTPAPWKPAEDEVEELQQRRTVLNQLNKQRTQLRNALGALKELPHYSEEAQGTLVEVLEHLEQQIKKLEQRAQQFMKAKFKELYQLLTSVSGVGPRLSMELLIVTRCFTRFSHVKQLVCYIGLCPRVFESGTSIRGKPRISKIGLSSTRKVLYMAALSAKVHNKDCRALYNRLVNRGKPRLVALIAVSHKLLRQAYAVASRGVPFVNGLSESLLMPVS